MQPNASGIESTAALNFEATSQQSIKSNQLIETIPVLPINAESKKLRPSIEEPPKLELKPLPRFLKYAFLGPEETLPVIIAADLEPNQ